MIALARRILVVLTLLLFIAGVLAVCQRVRTETGRQANRSSGMDL
jgi:F0F1-type ATP synthase assembly protein I